MLNHLLNKHQLLLMSLSPASQVHFLQAWGGAPVTLTRTTDNHECPPLLSQREGTMLLFVSESPKRA